METCTFLTVLLCIMVGSSESSLDLDKVAAQVLEEMSAIQLQGKLLRSNEDRLNEDSGFNRQTETSKAMTQQEHLLESASAALAQSLPDHHEGDPEFDSVLSQVLSKLRFGTSLTRDSSDLCPEQNPPCNATQIYRSVNGSCNNLDNALWGATDVEARRFLPPAYTDNLGLIPRGGFYNVNSSTPPDTVPQSPGSNCTDDPTRPLPSARLVSTSLNDQQPNPSNLHTAMLMQFGQFLDHDLTSTPTGSVFAHCCKTPNQFHCFPISVPAGDKAFADTCTHFVRSVAYCRKPGSSREQMNSVTAFVDASNTYGSTEAKGKLLRSLKDGKLKVGKYNLIDMKVGAADGRFTVVPGLSGMHTLFIREHNRIATEVKALQPSWTDETIYQESRRILIGEWQNVVFGEYVPIVVGVQNANKSKLSLQQRSAYDPKSDPSIRNSFAAASFRFGHSQIPDVYQSFDCASGALVSTFRLRNLFFNTTVYEANAGKGMEQLLFGLTKTPVETVDRYFSDDVTNDLFASPDDLVARNVQRGRDHGLPSYNQFRKMCGMTTICSWANQPLEISKANWNTLKQLYRHPIDIDLYVGGISEERFENGLTGRTFNCINTRQFKLLKDGDRFFFTHSKGPNAFSDAQVDSLKSRTLADIICDNTEVKIIRQKVFELNSTEVSCADRNRLDVGLFVNQKP